MRSGLTVALIGVSANPSAARPWWRADGSPLPAAPYASAGGTVGRVPPGRLAREFAVRFDTDPSTPTTKIWHADYAFPGLPAGDVRTLSYHARPFDAWVEFRNVAVHAGQATSVAVVTSDDPPESAKR